MSEAAILRLSSTDLFKIRSIVKLQLWSITGLNPTSYSFHHEALIDSECSSMNDQNRVFFLNQKGVFAP